MHINHYKRFQSAIQTNDTTLLAGRDAFLRSSEDIAISQVSQS
jgi:hypothetical protein